MQLSKPITKVVRTWSEVFMHRSMHEFKGFMKDTGLSFSQINILMRLLHGGSIGVSDIGEEMGVTIAAASQSVERLVQMGFIERTEDKVDRRVKRLELATNGRKLIEKGIEARSKWLEIVTDSLTSDQQSIIISALTILTQAAQKPGN